jgi:hypothetical protein
MLTSLMAALGAVRLGVLLSGAALCLAAAADAALIVRRSGGGAATQLAPALARAIGQKGVDQSAKLLELSGDGPADSAKIAREAKGVSVLFAIGPDATEAAGEARGAAVVSLGVPNPARVRTPGTYVSIYPRLERVLDYVRNRLKAKQAGFVFSPAKNREIALAFLKAGEAQGITVTPIPVSSSGDLTRELRKAIAGVDVLLLAVDPILFDPGSLEFIVDEARAARKPTVGFLDELPKLGITVSLVLPPAAAAEAAVEAAREPVTVGKRRVEVDSSMVIVSKKGAEAVGLSPEAFGAQRID